MTFTLTATKNPNGDQFGATIQIENIGFTGEEIISILNYVLEETEAIQTGKIKPNIMANDLLNKNLLKG